jgi:subtilisin-like proprotein convertase family protein
MRRAACLVALLVLAAPASAHAATRTYSTGPISVPVPDGGAGERALLVRDAGPVSHVAVEVRVEHPRDRDLTLTLTSPAGRTVTLFAGRGNGSNLGTGRDCGGVLTEFDDSFGEPLDSGSPPYVGAFQSDQPLSAFDGEPAPGRWTLRVRSAAGGGAGTLLCWRLTLSRNVLTVERARRGHVTAELSYRESNGVFRQPRLRILRGGRRLLDTAMPRPGCFGACPGWRPVGPPVVRDLDTDGEPEVIVDTYSGGAHCCTYSLLYRYTGRRYARLVHGWGNSGYRLVDLDGDGRPELRSSDDRFAYAFASYAATLEPVQVWRYDRGGLIDVTRRFPALIRSDAASAWRLYLRERRRRPREVRGILAAWLADQLLLGRGPAGWQALEEAYRRGELGRGQRLYGYPAGQRYLAALRAFLRRTGYGS